MLPFYGTISPTLALDLNLKLLNLDSLDPKQASIIRKEQLKIFEKIKDKNTGK